MAEIGKIRDVSIEIEDHGFLTMWIVIEAGCTVQGFGGCKLSKNQVNASTNEYLTFRVISDLLRIFEVSSLSELIGKEVVFERECAFGRITRITKQGSFCPATRGCWWFSFEDYKWGV